MTADIPRAAPRIYVASLADYNSGRLHGRWIDVSGGLDQVRAQIASMLQASPTPGAEEWAIHDHEGFEPLRIRESASLTWLTDIGAGIRRHGEAFAVWEAHINHGREQASKFDTCYLGYWLPSAATSHTRGFGDHGTRLIPSTVRGFYAFRIGHPRSGGGRQEMTRGSAP